MGRGFDGNVNTKTQGPDSAMRRRAEMQDIRRCVVSRGGTESASGVLLLCADLGSRGDGGLESGTVTLREVFELDAE